MEKSLIFALITGLSFTVLSACGGGSQSSRDKVDSLVTSDETNQSSEAYYPDPNEIDEMTFGGIGFSSKREDVIKILGEPEKTEKGTNNFDEATEVLDYPSKGVRVMMINPNMGSLTLTGTSTLKCNKNIGMGSSLEDLKEAFKGYDVSEEGLTVIGTSNSLWIKVEGGKVVQIVLSARMD
jgi:hypothetical protein